MTKKEGLSQNSVIAIAQDGKGYLWFGTRDGLNRYDGHEFRVYRRQKDKANSLAFNHAHSLYYDTERDWLWVGTTRGLCRYRQETDDFVTYGAPESLQHGFIHFTYRDRSGILWVGTDEGLFRHQPEDDSFLRLAGLPTQAYRVMAEDSSGQLLVGTPAGVFKIALSSALDRVSLSPLFPGGTNALTPYVQDILPGPQGEIWIATRFSGLLRWAPGQDQPRRFHAGGDARHRLSNDNVRALAWGQDGSLWAGTFVGLNRLTPGADAFEFQHEDPEDGEVFLSHSIHSLFVDQRGSLWVGSYYGGVALYDEVLASIQRYPSRGGDEKIGVVGTFTNGPRGVMWVGSEGTGVHAFVRGRGVTRTYDSQDGLAGNNAKSLLYQDGELWIGFYQAGLCRLNLATGEARCNEDLLPPYLLKKVHNVYGLLLRKDTLWLSDYGQGITWLDTRTGQGGNLRHQENKSNSLLANQCNYLIGDSVGQLWVATSRGVSRLQLRPGKQPRFTNYLHGKIVHTLQEDNDGRIWAGTYGQGLFVIDPATGKTEHLTDADLEESTIYGIVRDAADRLWVTTNQGIYHQDPRSGRFRNFGGSGDLDEQEYGKNALIRDPSGALFFGGTGGITSFKPADLPTDVYHPPLVFTELRVANQTVAIDPDNGILQRAIDGTTELELPYNNANFSLSFASLDFLSPQSNRYEYKLDGVDEDWVSTRGATAASYTLQDAGSYRFRVRSFRGDERMPIAERELLVNVLPPPWRSWYAYLLYALVVGLAIAAAVRYTYLRHELKLEQAAKDQQEALHQAKLRFFTNITHELRTPLTLMLGPLESIRRSGEVKGPAAERLWSVEKNSRRLLDLVNQLLSFRKLSGERENLNLDGRDVVEFSRDVTHSFRELAREREITLRYQSKEAHVELKFDADKIEKVLY
ncbi:MAG: two-component regulator propeller domain-containing protein, partial [Bacteroidota bacterium]